MIVVCLTFYEAAKLFSKLLYHSTLLLAVLEPQVLYFFANTWYGQSAKF